LPRDVLTVLGRRLRGLIPGRGPMGGECRGHRAGRARARAARHRPRAGPRPAREGLAVRATAQRRPFTNVRPRGWSPVPGGPAASAAIRTILDRAVAGVDDARAVRVRRRLQELLHQQVKVAEAQSATELYLPTEQVHAVSVPASVVVSVP